MLKLGGIPSKNSSRAILKCTNEIHKWKAEVEENTKLPFRRKGQKIKRQISLGEINYFFLRGWELRITTEQDKAEQQQQQQQQQGRI